MNEQLIVFVTLLLVLIMFAWGRWRYDIVAVIAMLIITISGIIPFEGSILRFQSSGGHYSGSSIDHQQGPDEFRYRGSGITQIVGG